MPACSATTAPSPAATAIFRSSARGTSSPRRHDQPQAERADRERQAEEPEPAHDVLGDGRPARAVRAFTDGGAGTRTPNVQTPETTCESAEIACQRTVYAPSLQRARRARRSCVPVHARRPREVLADAVQHLDRARQHRHVLVEAQADRAAARAGPPCRTCGDVARSVACADAAAGKASASEPDEQRCASPVRRPRERRQMAEDRRDVAVGEEHHRDGDDHQREARRAAPTSAAARRARAGRARRRGTSSRAGGAGTPSARRTTGSARGR